MAQLTVARYKRGVIAVKDETTYLTDPTLAAANILELRNIVYASELELVADDRQSGLIWPLPEIPGLRRGTIAAEMLNAGAGATYSASVKPPSHAVLRAAGMIGAYTASPDKWTFTWNNAATYAESVAGAFYAENAPRAIVLGALAERFTIQGRTAQPDIFGFTLRGKYSEPTDTAHINLTTPATVQPPVGKGAIFTWDGITTLRLYEWSLDFGVSLGESLSASAADGLAGYHLMRNGIMGTFVIEQVPVATYNFFNKRDLGTLAPISWQTGTVQFNRCLYSAPKVQIRTIQQVVREGLLCWSLGVRLLPSTGGDDLTMLYS